MDYQEQVEEVISTATFGDLIEFSYPIGYSHWAVYDEDGHVFHFAVSDEAPLMYKVRNFVQNVLPVCGDLLLGVTKIRRMPLSEVTVPEGAQVSIANTRHAHRASDLGEMRRRRNALLDKEFVYKILSCNCEHFATFVRYGKSVCNQIPGKAKNMECEEATAIFQDVVETKEKEAAERSLLFKFPSF